MLTNLSTQKNSQIAFLKPTLTRNELKSVLETLILDGVDNGEAVRNYEKEFATAFDYQKALAVTSVTSAYHLAFLAAGAEEGSEVILPSTAPVSALDALGLTGATPVLTDIGRDSFHPTMEQIAEKMTARTRAIVLPYTFGSFQDFESLRDRIPSSDKKNIKFIEDISYMAGAEYQNHFAGGNADIAIVGLNPDMIMTIGKGAIVLTDQNTTYATMKDLRMHGGSRPYRMRFDYSITDYQAAMGMEQLSLLPTVLERRQKIGSLYLDAIRNSRLKTYFFSPGTDAFGTFPVLFETDMEHATRYFQSQGIEVRKIFGQDPLHVLLDLHGSEFPNTQRLQDRGLLLPLYPYLTKLNVERITSAIKGFY